MRCDVCREFLPPGFTEPIPDSKNKNICKFCKEGKNRILTVSKVDNHMHWDDKNQIIKEYKQFLNEIVHNKEKRQNLYRGINENN